MFRLGLTGSIATGKSTVLAAFAACGVPIFSADAAVANLYAGDAVAAVEGLVPGVAVDGRIDRQRLAQKLANDSALFSRLEAIVHPLVRARIAAFLAEAADNSHQLAVVEVPLLLESGYDYGFDAVAVTHVDAAMQRQRALARPGMTVEKLATILARQMPQEEKKKRANFHFDTGMSVEQTQAQVAALVTQLKATEAR